MGVSYRSPHDDDGDKVFRQFEEASGSQPMVLMGDLKVSDMVGCK